MTATFKCDKCGQFKSEYRGSGKWWVVRYGTLDKGLAAGEQNHFCPTCFNPIQLTKKQIDVVGEDG